MFQHEIAEAERKKQEFYRFICCKRTKHKSIKSNSQLLSPTKEALLYNLIGIGGKKNKVGDL